MGKQVPHSVNKLTEIVKKSTRLARMDFFT